MPYSIGRYDGVALSKSVLQSGQAQAPLLIVDRLVLFSNGDERLSEDSSTIYFLESLQRNI